MIGEIKKKWKERDREKKIDFPSGKQEKVNEKQQELRADGDSTKLEGQITTMSQLEKEREDITLQRSVSLEKGKNTVNFNQTHWPEASCMA